MNAITFGPRLWCSTSAATEAPATVGIAQHRRVTADHQNFTKLHDRADFAGDLAYLEHIIRNDAVLPAAGFDDCEHRLIPSCSIPASDLRVRVGFLVSRYGYDFRADPRANPYEFAQKQAAREIPRRMAGLIAADAASQGKEAQNRPKMKDLARNGRIGEWRIANGRPLRSIRYSPFALAPETNGFPGRCPGEIQHGQGNMAEDIITTTGIARHGATRLPSVEVDSFNIELKDDDGFLGDRASKGAFRKILDGLRKPLKKNGRRSPWQEMPPEEIAKKATSTRRWSATISAPPPGAWRDRGVRAGTGLCDAAVPQDQGMGRYRAHRGRRRLSARAGSANSPSRAPTSSSRPRTSKSIWCRSAFIPMTPA